MRCFSKEAAQLLSCVKELKEIPAGLIAESKLQSLNELRYAKLSDEKWLFQLVSNDVAPTIITDSEYKNQMLYADKGHLQDRRLQFLIRTAFECRFCYEGIVSLHAACVENGEYAVAFTGRSGMGKSTRAKAWVDGLGFEWISGDRPAVRLEKEGSTACGVPWDGKEQIFRDVERPLKAIMEVRRSPANYIRKLTPDQARQLLMQQTFVPMWDTDAAVMAMANVRMLIKKTPVYRVFCGPTEEDARQIYEILFNHPEQIREEAEDMKIKDGFVLRNVVDEFIVMPTGENIAKFDGAVVLNEVSAFVYKQLEHPTSKEDVLEAVLAEFEVDRETAAKDLDTLLENFKQMGLLDA